MNRRRFIWIGVASLIIATVALETWGIVSQSPHATPRSHYGPFAIGDPKSKIDQPAASPDYILIGDFDRSSAGATWTHHHVEGGPMRYELSPTEIARNRFWHDLGWTYPATPPPHHAVVLAPTNGLRSPMLFLYLDANDDIQTIYVGGS